MTTCARVVVMIIDFLSFTACEATLHDLLVCLDDWAPCQPLKGYRAGFQHPSGIIYSYDGYGFAEGTTLVKASGQSVQVLLPFVSDQDRVTRVDFAFDMVGDDVITVEDVFQAQRSDNICSCVAFRGGFFGKDGSTETLYWGRRDGTCVVRVYDKAREQKVDGCWTRLEYEMHGESARLAFDLYNSNVEDCIAFLASRWRVVDAGGEPRRKRPLAAWFVELVGSRFQRFSPVRAVSSLRSKCEFARKALGSVRLLMEVQGACEVISELLRLPLTQVQKQCISQADWQISKTLRTTSPLKRAAAGSIRRRLSAWFLPQTGAKISLNSPSLQMSSV